MLPMLLAKLSDSISRGLMSYKNLKISKDKVVDIIEEPEETGSMEPLQTATHEINFDSVDFSYVPGEPVLKHATFTVPDQKLTAIVGDSGSGKSTILNLIAKYYEATGGTISIGGKPINHVAAERVLEQISMVDQDVFLLAAMMSLVKVKPSATPPAGQGSGSMKEQAARQQGAALQKGAATEDRQEKTTAQAAASAKYREDGVPQQELERFARFLLPKIQAFYQSEEGQRLFEEWINRRNAEEKTGKCKGS